MADPTVKEMKEILDNPKVSALCVSFARTLADMTLEQSEAIQRECRGIPAPVSLFIIMQELAIVLGTAANAMDAGLGSNKMNLMLLMTAMQAAYQKCEDGPRAELKQSIRAQNSGG